MENFSAKILVVDDDGGIRKSLSKLLESMGHSVVTAPDGLQGLAALRAESPDLVLMDIRMPKSSGLDILKEIRKADAKVPVIIMTAHGTTSTAIEAIKAGAYDYILKPFDIPGLQDLVRKALEASAMMRHTVAVAPLDHAEQAPETLIGKSKAMQEIYKTIGRIAESDISVLLEGESGTGKELVARAIYHHSLRSQKPYLAVNCAAIPETLLESELFGHERGAFTDAKTTRIGKFEQCHGGTLFLDEIGDMTLATQAKVLRILQEKEFQRVGGTEVIKVNVRMLAATNKNLRKAIADGSFREDLYYRLNVLTLSLPALRERKEDIPLLTNYFVKKFTPAGRHCEIVPAAVEKLKNHDWPGNVRQLENAVKRAIAMSKKGMLLPADFHWDETAAAECGPGGFSLESHAKGIFAEMLRCNASSPDTASAVMDRIESRLIELALEHTQGNQLRAAKLLGVNRNTLRKKMQAYRISGRYTIGA